MKSKADKKQIDFNYHISPGSEKIVVGDEFRLNQILINLVSNAIKFTDNGSVEINCNLVNETHDRFIYSFEVRDTGVGIPEDKVNVIFEQFKQADSAVTKKYGGTGLGLTISKKLVEMQNGSINLQSKPGKGTNFKVILPFGKGDETNYIKGDFDKTLIRFKGKRALVVDDDSVNRLLGQTILHDFGFEVDLAVGGAEAIDKLARLEYDVVILDIHMPGVSGIDVADYLRQSRHDRKTKILAVTAAFMKEDVKKYKISGINDYLIKPFREQKLYNKLCKLMGYRSSQLHLKNKQLKKHTKHVKGGNYDLTELRNMAKDDVEFINTMIDTFIQNVSEGISNLEKSVRDNDLKATGEIAHKLLPSYIHLGVKQVIPLLKNLEKAALYNADYASVPALVDKIVLFSTELVQQLKIEMDVMESTINAGK